MSNMLVAAICDYFDVLRNDFKLYVTIHSTGAYNIYLVFPNICPYNLHDNPYCLSLKLRQRAIWNKCIYCQRNVSSRAERGEYSGTCHAGVFEYIYPISYKNELQAFISVSGYRDNSERALHKIRRLSEEFQLDNAALLSSYEKYLSPDIPDKSRIDALVHPLCYMFELLFQQDMPKMMKDDIWHNSSYNLFRRLNGYITSNHTDNISVKQLADIYNYSESYISHTFKQFSGMSIPEYVNELRLKESAELLKKTSLNISDIAMTVGFSDSNYYSNLFKRKYGISPSKFRAKINIQNENRPE